MSYDAFGMNKKSQNNEAYKNMQKSIEKKSFFKPKQGEFRSFFIFFPLLKNNPEKHTEKKVVKVINFLSVNIEHTKNGWENFSYFLKKICSFSMA
jgi:hypothetical protein